MRLPEAQAKTRLFGTDGVRGTANVWPMTAEVAMQLGRRSPSSSAMATTGTAW